MISLAFLLALLLDSTYGVSESELVLARQRFNSLKLQDYSYEYKQGPCFCIPEAFQTKVVTVKNGALKSVILVDNKMPYEYSPGTILDVFAAIEAALKAGKLVEATFDAELGIPLGDIKIDTEAFAYDGGKWWIISNFSILVCAQDTIQCPNGSWSSRDPSNRCNFKSCNTRVCTADSRECPDGSFVSRDPKNDCQFPLCPSIACPDDARQCPDGSFVTRNTNDGCNFFDCPTVVCTAETRRCPDGSWIGPDTKNNCKFPDCPTPVCTADALPCPDGSWISPDPRNNCKIPECPILVCTQEAKICTDGSAVGRDSSRGCAFEVCPEDVFPFIRLHKQDLVDRLKAKTEFIEVEVLDANEDEEVVLSAVSSGSGVPDLEKLKLEFASFVGIRPARVLVSQFEIEGQKRAETRHWLITLNVDEYSMSSVVQASLATLLLVVGWMWI